MSVLMSVWVSMYISAIQSSMRSIPIWVPEDPTCGWLHGIHGTRCDPRLWLAPRPPSAAHEGIGGAGGVSHSCVCPCLFVPMLARACACAPRQRRRRARCESCRGVEGDHLAPLMLNLFIWFKRNPELSRSSLRLSGELSSSRSFCSIASFA